MAGSSGVPVRAAPRTSAASATRRQIAADASANVQLPAPRVDRRGETEAAQGARLRLWLDGVRVRDLERLAAGVLAGVLPRVYPQMLKIAYDHQDAGRPVYICTAASQGMADMLAHVLGFDGAAARASRSATASTPAASTARSATARASRPRIRELAERDGLDLAASYAYSDSASDIPMLRAVGHPVAVNPDAELRRTARAEGWEVLRFERLGRRLKIGAACGGPGGPGRRRPGATGSRTPSLRARRQRTAPGPVRHGHASEVSAPRPHDGGRVARGLRADARARRAVHDAERRAGQAALHRGRPAGGRGDRPARRLSVHPRRLPVDVPGRLWTMRQFAGFGTAEETNERFRYLLDHGQTGLSTAFDMPSLMGHDSDHRGRSARSAARASRSTRSTTWRRCSPGSTSARSPSR